MRKFYTIFILLVVLMSGCSSVRVIDGLDLADVFIGMYMGTKDDFHHFIIPEKETVFYEHVKVPIQNLKVDVQMPYTNDKTKWKRINVDSISIHMDQTVE